MEIKKQAEDLKAKGNEFYKKKDFENALKFYQEAIDKDPQEITFYSNKLALYFEMKNKSDLSTLIFVACCLPNTFLWPYKLHVALCSALILPL